MSGVAARMSSTAVVREFEPHLAARWTAFVQAHPDATLYHTLEWCGVIQAVFGHRPRYLVCERAGEVTGVLPLFHVAFPGLGSKLISMPYDAGAGGPLATDPDSGHALAEKALDLCRQLGARFVQFRCGGPNPAMAELPFVREEPLVMSEVDFSASGSVWDRVAVGQRQAIRQAATRGVQIREAESLDDVHAYYQVYLQAFREFGTPPYGPTYFPEVWNRIRPIKGVRLLIAEVEGRCVGGLVLYCWGRNLINKFTTCTSEAVPLRAYPALYGRAMQLGVDEGFRSMNWGTAARHQTGLIEFKERWGAIGRPVVFYTFARRGQVPSIERYYDSEGIERRAWRHLPLSATRVMGTWLSKWFC